MRDGDSVHLIIRQRAGQKYVEVVRQPSDWGVDSGPCSEDWYPVITWLFRLLTRGTPEELPDDAFPAVEGRPLGRPE